MKKPVLLQGFAAELPPYHRSQEEGMEWLAAATGGSVPAGTLVVSLAFGPGLTIAGALFRKC